MSEKPHKSKIKAFFTNKKTYYGITIIFVFLFLLTMINPVKAAAPYQIPDDDTQLFALQSMAVWKEIEVNATIPEGDSLYENNSLGWQIINIRYEMTKSIALDAASAGSSPLLHGSHIQKFADEYWYEGFGYDILNNPIVMSPKALENIFIKDEKDVGNITEHTFTPLAKSLDAINFFSAEKTSGYRYRGVAPSPLQMGVLFCNNHGYIFHNVTNASTRFLGGFGGLRPSYTIETLSEPCEINYNLSYSNPTLILKPANNSEADLSNSLGKKDFSSNELINFEVKSNNTWIADACPCLTTIIIIGVVVAAVVALAVTSILVISSLATKLAESNLQVGFGVGNLYGAQTADPLAYKRATDLYEVLMENEILKISEELNLTKLELAKLLEANNRVAGYVRANYSNPYDAFPSLGGFSPFSSASEISVVVWYVVATVIIVFGLIALFLVIRKIRSGGKKSEEKKAGSQEVNVNITEKTPGRTPKPKKAKTSLFNVIKTIFNFGISTGAI